MRIIDRYILKQFLSTFFFVVFLLVLIIVVIDITEKMETFTSKDLTFLQVAGFYLDYIPWLANTITPITVFIATVFVTAKMASHTEIIAMLSSGVSFRRFLAPYLVGAFFLGSISFYFMGWVIPNATKSRVKFENEYLESRYSFSERDTHLQEDIGKFVYIRNFNSNSKTGYNFTLEQFHNNDLIEKLFANSVHWIDSAGLWRLKDWQLRVLEVGKVVIAS